MILGVYGSGSLGREILELATRRNAVSHVWSEIVFIDDVREEGSFSGARCLRFETMLKNKDAYQCVVANGEPIDREAMFNKLVAAGVRSAILIDPTVLLSPTAKIGEGTVICEFSTIHADVQIGRNCVVQPYCNIGHHIKIGNHAVLSTHCAPGGMSVLGNRVFAGMLSSIKDKTTVGDDAIIGMGAAVFQDVPAGSTVVGNPARITRGNAGHRVFNNPMFSRGHGR